jgi:hypothetical protein
VRPPLWNAYGGKRRRMEKKVRKGGREGGREGGEGVHELDYQQCTLPPPRNGCVIGVLPI